MSSTEIPDLSGMLRFVGCVRDLGKRGMRAALASAPKCRLGMLENLHFQIEQHGQDGAIYVSVLARAMHQPMPAVSRGLRFMEQDGHIVRETDPKDRRKTLVRITPAGERARKVNEQAMNDYFARIMARLTPEQLAQANAVKDALLAAIEAENAAMKTDLKGEPPHDENF